MAVDSKPTRREMLQRSAMAMAAAGISVNSYGQEDIPTVRVAMIGDRGHNDYVKSGLARMPYAQVVAIADGSESDRVDNLERWCQSRNYTTKRFSDYRLMLDEVKPDVVTVCGPFELHAQMSIDAFERGIPVFTEKLAATTHEDFVRLQEAHAKAEVHYASMMGLRYDPAFYTAWRAVQDGAIGEVRLIQAQKSYILGNREPYYYKRETSSGLIGWVGSHAIDWIYWFTGKPFTQTFAVHSSQGNHNMGDLEVSAQCQFELEGGITANASLDYLRPSTAGSHGDDRVRVAGSEGVIEVREGKALLINGSQRGVQQLDTRCDLQIFENFVHHVQGKTKAILTAQDVFEVTKACLCARDSADTKKSIQIT